MAKTRSAARVVVITGASAGVGRAAALRFAGEGYAVGLIARDEAALAQVAAEIAALGGSACHAAADVADAARLFAAADAIEAALGPADIWVNDAMAAVFAPVWETTPEEFRRVTDVTYLGAVHGTMAALRSMRPRKRGTIVQVGSAVSFHGIPLQAAYSGAKYAVRGFTEALRAELVHDRSRIRLTMVHLPGVNTPQFDWARTRTGYYPRPMGRPVQPEVAAGAVFRAARGCWREYWLGGSTAATVLGSVLAPGLLDRVMGWAGVSGQQADLDAGPRRDNLDEPVAGLHRLRGSFGRDAREHAALVPGDLARLGAAALGALACLKLGEYRGARRLKRRRDDRGSAGRPPR